MFLLQVYRIQFDVLGLRLELDDCVVRKHEAIYCSLNMKAYIVLSLIFSWLCLMVEMSVDK